MSRVLEGYFYAESHEWAKKEDQYAYIGITDFAQAQLGNVVFVDLPEVGALVKKGKEFGAVESVKAASDLISPISGKVVEINEDLVGEPEAINQDAFASWLIKVEISNPADFDDLMSAEAYKNIAK